MAEREIIVMSIGEVRRFKAVQASIDGHVTQKTAAAILGLSERQVRHLVKDVRLRGDKRANSFPMRPSPIIPKVFDSSLEG
jgi:hypothetical protein